MKWRQWSSLIVVLTAVTARGQEHPPAANSLVPPKWESLSRYEAPAWYRDGKFGIFVHWGPQTLAGERGAADGAKFNAVLAGTSTLSGTLRVDLERLKKVDPNLASLGLLALVLLYLVLYRRLKPPA